MDFTKLPSNSQMGKKPRVEETKEPRFQSVVKNPTTIKKNGAKRFRDVFVSEDVSNVKQYAFMDVIVPAIKKAICDVVSDGVHMIFYGTTAGRRPGDSARRSYDRISSSRSRDRYRDDRYSYDDDRRRRFGNFDYDDVAFETKADADMVIDSMFEAIESYPGIDLSVADFYQLSGRDNYDHTANDFGWPNLDIRDVKSYMYGSKWYIKLPKARPIDNN